MTDFEHVLGGAGFRVSAAALDRAYEQSATFLGRLWVRNRDVSVGEHVRAILAAVDPHLPDRLPADVIAALVDAYSRPALMVPPTIDDGARAALETLRARGYVLGLISNTMRTPGSTLRRVLAGYGVLDCFSHVTFSDEVDIRKPDPEIFALTLRGLGADAAAAVHVGDDATLDVHGARAAGMRVIQVTSASLKALGARRPDAVIPSLSKLPDAVAELDA
jgi:HAD superfamily hydrolase (TIGR01509 family)